MPQSLIISKSTTVQLPASSLSVHATHSFRHMERYDDVLIKIQLVRGYQNLLPWVRVFKIFTTSDGREWLLASRAHYVDSSKPLSAAVGAPHLRFDHEAKVILPIETVWQRVILIQDNVNPRHYTVCWWINSGKLAYPEDHRYEILMNT